VHADGAVRALHQAAAVHGARLLTRDRAVALEPGPSSVGVPLASGRRLEADAVVVAAGAWTQRLLAGVVTGLPPLRTTQEQPVHFASSVPADEWPSFIHHGGAALPAAGGIYGLGSVDGVKAGEHAVGPVVDPDDRDGRIDDELRRAVVDYAREWLPGVDADSARPTTCLYTSTPTSDFVVDRQGPITVLAGFSGHGFKFAPAIGVLAAELTLDRVAAPPRFALDRAAEVSLA
jgi:sarcosine oxidase